jgi:hypothetical protein
MDRWGDQRGLADWKQWGVIREGSEFECSRLMGLMDLFFMPLVYLFRIALIVCTTIKIFSTPYNYFFKDFFYDLFLFAYAIFVQHLVFWMILALHYQLLFVIIKLVNWIWMAILLLQHIDWPSRSINLFDSDESPKLSVEEISASYLYLSQVLQCTRWRRGWCLVKINCNNATGTLST